MIILIAGLIVFLGIHSARMFFPGFRNSIIDQRGENAWKGIYTVISFVGLALLIWGYGTARVSEANTFFYAAAPWATHLVWLLMVPVMILLVASQLPAGRIKKAVKNPMLTAVKTWAIAHLLVNGDLASFLFFGAFLVWAILLVISTNRRGEPVQDAIAFASDIKAVVGGIVLWAIFAFALHEWLIGVPAIA